MKHNDDLRYFTARIAQALVPKVKEFYGEGWDVRTKLAEDAIDQAIALVKQLERGDKVLNDWIKSRPIREKRALEKLENEIAEADERHDRKRKALKK